MKTNNENSCKEESCVAKQPFARENYYFGKLLTAKSLQSEQNYFNEKRWIINRYGFGWGVLCGLKVAIDPNNTCNIVVEPGLAIDKNGNEIVVCEAVPVDLKGACLEQQEPCENDTGDSVQKIYISIRYKECQTQPSPVPVDDCCDVDGKFNYNRSNETYHIGISCDEPEKPKTIREECKDLLDCESDCSNFLENPGAVLINKCVPRQQWCEITLACICYRDSQRVLEQHIDNISYRKLAFSNETLYAMIRCLAEQSGHIQAKRYDRRQHIPLLANTIKGLSYQDGKNITIDQNVGSHPFRLTSDGDRIWITDRKSPNLVRIERLNNQVIEPQIDLSCCNNAIKSSWGIAFDGKYIWISHNNEGHGRISRINSCEPDNYKSFYALPECKELNECEGCCTEYDEKDLIRLPAYPQEMVYHQDLLYVSHGWEPKSQPERQVPTGDVSNDTCDDVEQTFLITVISTRQCCLLKIIEIKFTESCIPLSPITSMVSDGKRLWISYAADFKYDKKCSVVQSIEINPETLECKFGSPCKVGKDSLPEKLAFDGTHLWLTHEDGATKIALDSGKDVAHVETKQQQLAIAYGGGDNIWTIEFNTNGATSGEARIKRTDIHSGKECGEIEYFNYSEKRDAAYSITDAQFDGVFVYISAFYEDATTPTKGLIHRILP